MKLEKLLNQQVGNLIVLYVKLHNYHWYVSGCHFYGLHAKFEELYDETTELYDEVAEIMLMEGLKPVATLKDSLAVATIKEATNKESKSDMVQSLLADYKQLKAETLSALEVAEAEGNVVVADLLTSLSVKYSKHIWMLGELVK